MKFVVWYSDESDPWCEKPVGIAAEYNTFSEARAAVGRREIEHIGYVFCPCDEEAEACGDIEELNDIITCGKITREE